MHAALTTRPDDVAGASVRERLAVALTELGALRDAVAAGTLAVATLVSVEPGLLARIDTDQREETRLTTPSFLHGLITPGADVAARWAQMPISAQREVARTLLTPRLLGALHVNRRPPSSGPRHVPAPDRVTWIRDGDPTPDPRTQGMAEARARR